MLKIFMVDSYKVENYIRLIGYLLMHANEKNIKTKLHFPLKPCLYSNIKKNYTNKKNYIFNQLKVILDINFENSYYN